MPRAKQLRGDALVEKVLDVTIDHMLRFDPNALSVEQIAAAAGVNKTTVYRRWGTLGSLVREAGQRMLDSLSTPRNCGTLQLDLEHYFGGIREILTAVRLRGAKQLHFDNTDVPDELRRIHDEFEQQKRQELLSIFRRAVRRGELPARYDTELLGHVLAGAIMQLTLFTPEGCDDERIGAVVHLVLEGARGYRPKEA